MLCFSCDAATEPRNECSGLHSLLKPDGWQLLFPSVICTSAAVVAVLQVMQKYGLFCLKQIPDLLEMCH